jgi:hypothetical protein
MLITTTHSGEYATDRITQYGALHCGMCRNARIHIDGLFSAVSPHRNPTLYTALYKLGCTVKRWCDETSLEQVPGVRSEAPGGWHKPTNTHV